MTDSPEARTVSSVSFAALLQKGVERIAELQKITLDLCAHQTTDLVDSWRRFAFPAASIPGSYLLDATGQGIHHFIEMQKSILELMLVQSLRGIEIIRPVEAAMSKIELKADEPGDESMDRVIAEQEEHAAIAAKVVDRIAELVSQAPPVVVPDAAMQQMQAGQVAQEEKSKLMVAQGAARRHHHAKNPNRPNNIK